MRTLALTQGTLCTTCACSRSTCTATNANGVASPGPPSRPYRASSSRTDQRECGWISRNGAHQVNRTSRGDQARLIDSRAGSSAAKKVHQAGAFSVIDVRQSCLDRGGAFFFFFFRKLRIAVGGELSQAIPSTPRSIAPMAPGPSSLANQSFPPTKRSVHGEPGGELLVPVIGSTTWACRWCAVPISAPRSAAVSSSNDFGSSDEPEGRRQLRSVRRVHDPQQLVKDRSWHRRCVRSATPMPMASIMNPPSSS